MGGYNLELLEIFITSKYLESKHFPQFMPESWLEAPAAAANSPWQKAGMSRGALKLFFELLNALIHHGCKWCMKVNQDFRWDQFLSVPVNIWQFCYWSRLKGGPRVA